MNAEERKPPTNEKEATSTCITLINDATRVTREIKDSDEETNRAIPRTERSQDLYYSEPPNLAITTINSETYPRSNATTATNALNHGEPETQTEDPQMAIRTQTLGITRSGYETVPNYPVKFMEPDPES
ncbi:hypothetical protein FOVG_16475 [Fusarium oxysporum f. sp. pisi HDV247]|uniref:Uncharacterized protein n=1 Tax=Fusarium oxysporum f. sp. pisi HDV247 TaxID=1080344 RepID=W9NNH1_FUSOX|nr:hypothetical protein FOVG_16475 [Fusarium oxysporum f. sp. pisi HDV247]